LPSKCNGLSSNPRTTQKKKKKKKKGVGKGRPKQNRSVWAEAERILWRKKNQVKIQISTKGLLGERKW
jgi:hypothetical protein